MTAAQDQRRRMAELRAAPLEVIGAVERAATVAEAARELGISVRSLHALLATLREPVSGASEF